MGLSSPLTMYHSGPLAGSALTVALRILPASACSWTLERVRVW